MMIPSTNKDSVNLLHGYIENPTSALRKKIVITTTLYLYSRVLVVQQMEHTLLDKCVTYLHYVMESCVLLYY